MIRTCVISDTRLERSGNTYWDPRQSFPEHHWTDLLRVFGEVEMYARVQHTTREDIPPHLALPAEVTVVEAPYYLGPRQFFGSLWKVWRAIWQITAGSCKFILRGPGTLSFLAWIALQLRRKPYAVEVLGDSGESLRFSAVRFRRVLSWFTYTMTRAICRRATAVLYISRALSRRYPASPKALSAVISDVRLPATIWREPNSRPTEPVTLITVANMEQPYKGHDSLLRALARLRREGREVRLQLAGDGRQRPNIEGVAADLGVREAVTFHGTVPWGPQLFDLLDRATLFVLPSLTEGLGKALLEAMARGIPGVGSDVGGITELLPDEARFPASDDAAMARTIARFIDDPAALQRLARACYEKAREYDDALLAPKRHEYYEALRKMPPTHVA